MYFNISLKKIIVLTILITSPLLWTDAWQTATAQEATKDIMVNGGFEAGIDGWQFLILEDAQMTPTIQNGELYADIMAPGTETFHIMVRQLSKPMVNGFNYTVQFDAHAAAERSIYVNVGQLDPPYTSYGNSAFDLTPETQTYEYSFEMSQPTDPCAVLEFQLGTDEIDVYLDNVSITTSVDAVVPPPDNLPPTQSPTGFPLSYHANDRGLTVGTAVQVVNVQCNALYRKILLDEFDSITPENEMKMENLQPSPGVYQFSDADALVDFATESNLELHGHPLIWYFQIPGWLEAGSFDRDEMIDIMNDYIDTVVTRYKGKVPIWDVVNEAITDDTYTLRSSVWLDNIGPDYIDLAFQRARQADPDAVLLYNDYNIVDINPKSDAVYDLVAGMIERDIPIDGVGFQTHLEEDNPPDPASVASNMARFAELGLQVYITEIDVRILEPASQEELENQAEIYRIVMAACLAAPNCDHYTTWGFTDKFSWIPLFFEGYDSAHLFDDDFMAKPAYFALIDELTSDPAPTPAPNDDDDDDSNDDDDNDSDDDEQDDDDDNDDK